MFQRPSARSASSTSFEGGSLDSYSNLHVDVPNVTAPRRQRSDSNASDDFVFLSPHGQAQGISRTHTPSDEFVVVNPTSARGVGSSGGMGSRVSSSNSLIMSPLPLSRQTSYGKAINAALSRLEDTAASGTPIASTPSVSTPSIVHSYQPAIDSGLDMPAIARVATDFHANQQHQHAQLDIAGTNDGLVNVSVPKHLKSATTVAPYKPLETRQATQKTKPKQKPHVIYSDDEDDASGDAYDSYYDSLSLRQRHHLASSMLPSTSSAASTARTNAKSIDSRRVQQQNKTIAHIKKEQIVQESKANNKVQQAANAGPTAAPAKHVHRFPSNHALDPALPVTGSYTLLDVAAHLSSTSCLSVASLKGRERLEESNRNNQAFSPSAIRVRPHTNTKPKATPARAQDPSTHLNSLDVFQRAFMQHFSPQFEYCFNSASFGFKLNRVEMLPLANDVSIQWAQRLMDMLNDSHGSGPKFTRIDALYHHPASCIYASQSTSAPPHDARACANSCQAKASLTTHQGALKFGSLTSVESIDSYSAAQIEHLHRRFDGAAQRYVDQTGGLTSPSNANRVHTVLVLAVLRGWSEVHDGPQNASSWKSDGVLPNGFPVYPWSDLEASQRSLPDFDMRSPMKMQRWNHCNLITDSSIVLPIARIQYEAITISSTGFDRADRDLTQKELEREREYYLLQSKKAIQRQREERERVQQQAVHSQARVKLDQQRQANEFEAPKYVSNHNSSVALSDAEDEAEHSSDLSSSVLGGWPSLSALQSEVAARQRDQSQQQQDGSASLSSSRVYDWRSPSEYEVDQELKYRAALEQREEEESQRIQLEREAEEAHRSWLEEQSLAQANADATEYDAYLNQSARRLNTAVASSPRHHENRYSSLLSPTAARSYELARPYDDTDVPVIAPPKHNKVSSSSILSVSTKGLDGPHPNYGSNDFLRVMPKRYLTFNKVVNKKSKINYNHPVKPKHMERLDNARNLRSQSYNLYENDGDEFRTSSSSHHRSASTPYGRETIADEVQQTEDLSSSVLGSWPSLSALQSEVAARQRAQQLEDESGSLGSSRLYDWRSPSEHEVEQELRYRAAIEQREEEESEQLRADREREDYDRQYEQEYRQQLQEEQMLSYLNPEEQQQYLKATGRGMQHQDEPTHLEQLSHPYDDSDVSVVSGSRFQKFNPSHLVSVSDALARGPFDSKPFVRALAKNWAVKNLTANKVKKGTENYRVKPKHMERLENTRSARSEFYHHPHPDEQY